MDTQQEEMEVVDASDLSLKSLPVAFDPTTLNMANLINTPQNKRLYQATQTLKTLINDLVDYQLAHPKPLKPSTREEIDKERKILREIGVKERRVYTQLSVVKALYRQSVLKVREEKAKTADDRAVDDALILGLHNLKYEEQSLRSEIAAAENYDHQYTKLPLIPVEEFLEKFPELVNSSEHDLMIARIDHESQERNELEAFRREKHVRKQVLIAEVKKGKEKLTNLDSMVEKFVEAAEPIKKVLATEE
ncbi:hypothetical protein K458DRAFT_417598 [Lentithecium fluviatile CBS 122367]|uniref:Fms interacting protein n=1 Tax=Lentithecium fluviatile CBS 122367 TaxID=1168545 RepID=A0A6G1J3D9_9PLEO|nr:hypothetical protein K458DRAFT_417598 [Lentithecium fluviatile CBS 122367]